MIAVLRRWLLKAVRRRTLRAELQAEMALHRELAAENGSSIPFGNPSVLHESALDLWRFNLIENCLRDVVFAVRRLRQSPGYTFAAVGSLALGIGLSTAMFSLFNAVVLRPLPYRDEARLVWFSQILSANNSYQITLTPDFLDWRRSNQTFEDIAGVNAQTSVITGLGRPFELQGVRSSASLLPLLRVRPFMGRNFTRGEDMAGGGHVVIVSYAFWRDHLSSDTAALGKILIVDGTGYMVVGVLSRDFIFPSNGKVDFLLPLARDETGELGRKGQSVTTMREVIGRLKPGVTIQEAHDNIAVIQAHLPLPPWHPTITIRMLPLRVFLFGDQRTTALVLVLGALLFLLVASANLGNLALSQWMQRERELAVRRALGATRSRVISQLVVENSLLSGTAGLLGIFVAWIVRNLLATMPSYVSAIYAQLPLDLRVVSFTALALALVVILFGLLPASRISDVTLSSAMKENQGTSTGRREHLRFLSAVASFEIAIVIALSFSAVLMVRSFWNMRYRELGIEPSHVISVTYNLVAEKYKDDGREHTFMTDLVTRAASLPGVEAASLAVASEIPPGGGSVMNTANVEGRPQALDSRLKPATKYQVVSADYLRVLGIPLVEGRFINSSDSATSQPVVVVSRSFAERYFSSPQGNAIGHRLHGTDMRHAWHSIVGIVGDVRSSGPAMPSDPLVYIPYLQSEGLYSRDGGLLLRTSLPLVAIAPAVRNLFASLDAELPISSIESIEQRLDHSVAGPAFTASLLSALSLLGLLLAMVGVYGLISCQIRSQLRELAVRQALGASGSRIIGQFLRNALAVTIAGLVGGLALAFGFAHLLSAMLFQVSAHEPRIFGAVCALALCTSLSACLFPAWKAARSNPLTVLREG